jgi:hypothetical protein
MKDFQVIYYDLINVPPDITSVININRFGKLRYRKTTLLQYTSAIFRENQITHIHHISDKSRLNAVIDQIAYSNTKNFILISSNLTIIDKQTFGLFLKKIQYIDDSLSLSDGNSLKPLLKLNKEEILDFLHAAQSSDEDFYDLLEEKFQHTEKFTQETFYLEIRSYVDLVKYLQSNFELRFFNSIQSTKNIITKRSEQKEKMYKEFAFYEFLTDDMKLFFLRPFGFEEHEEYAQYSLERLNVLDVSVQWIHFSLELLQFKNLLDRLFYFVSVRKKKKVSAEEVKKSAEKLYLSKLDDRVRDLKATEPFAAIEQIIKNSTSYESVQAVIEHYKKLFARIVTFKNYPDYITLSHGDLCFSNMLYDKRIDYLKLIDPKGYTREEDGYMDAHYDLAKLSHSILGNYDFINNGLFDLEYDNNLKVSLVIQGLDELKEMKAYFKEFLQKQGFSYPLVRLYEASLFLSMLPLHIDYPKKVVAYLLTGIKILEELEMVK